MVSVPSSVYSLNVNGNWYSPKPQNYFPMDVQAFTLTTIRAFLTGCAATPTVITITKKPGDILKIPPGTAY